jgi:hypothetical protein
MQRITVAAAVLALTALGAACGDDGGGESGGESSSEEGQEFVDAIAASSEESTLNGEESECFARAFVDAVGVDQLQAATTPQEIRDNPDTSPADLGITLDENQGDSLWDHLNGCMDVRAEFLETIAADDELPEEAVDCLESEMDNDLLKRLMVTAFGEGVDALQEDAELTEELVALFAACPDASADA